MEDFEKKIGMAKKKISIAEYMLTNTYAMLKEPKILLAILENVYDAFVQGLSGLLAFERVFKRIPPYKEELSSKINAFKLKIQNRLGFDDKYMITLETMQNIIAEHKGSPVEFSRHEKYVIANNKYDLKTITVEDLKEKIAICKSFLNKISKSLGGISDA